MAAAAAAFQSEDAHCRLLKWEYLFEHIRATLRSRRGFNVNQKTGADINRLHKLETPWQPRPKKGATFISIS